MSTITAPAVQVLPAFFQTKSAVDFPGGVFKYGSALYMPVTNPCTGLGAQQSWASGGPPPTNCKARMLRSTDNGTTWAEVNADTGPNVALVNHTVDVLFRGFTTPLSAVLQTSSTLVVAYWKWDYVFGDPCELAFSTFNMATNTWGTEQSSGITQTHEPSRMQVAVRSSDGGVIIAWDGPTENVMAVDYARCLFALYTSMWTPAMSIDATQSGTQLNYTVAGVVTGTSSRAHFFYTIGDPNGGTSTVNSLTFTSADVLESPVVVAVNDINTLVPLPISYTGGNNIGVQYLRGFPLGFFSSAVSTNSPTFTEQAQPLDNGGDNGPVFNSSSLVSVSDETGDYYAWQNLSGAAGGWNTGTFIFTPDPTFTQPRPPIGTPVSGLGTAVVVEAGLPDEDSFDPQLYFFGFGGKICLLVDIDLAI